MKFNLINHFDSKELIFNAIISNICELINLLRRGDSGPGTLCELTVTPLSNAFGTKIKKDRGIKNKEDHLDQISPLILYERSHNYDWSIRVRLMQQ